MAHDALHRTTPLGDGRGTFAGLDGGGSGWRLSDPVRTSMEEAFGTEFDDVRVHSAPAAARALGARAFTGGSDIHVDPGNLPPGPDAGEALLAHELAHVVQQREGRVERGTIGRWASLGQECWSVPGSTRRVMKVWVGSESEWRGVLKAADDDDTYYTSLQGFLKVANDPSLVGKLEEPLGVLDYENTIERAPTHGEIVEFLKALYGLGEDLDLSPHWLLGGGEHLPFMRRDLATFLGRYQGEVIKLVSAGGTDGSYVMSQESVAAVAEEGGRQAREKMVSSAITTSVEGLAQLIRAHAEGDEKGKSTAYSIIGNAGLVIRHTLDVHEAAVKFEGEINMFLIDFVLDIAKLDELRGVQALLRRAPAVKSALKTTIKDMGKSAASSANPIEQAASIAENFENQVKNLGPAVGEDSVLDANSERTAITTFSTALGKK